MKKEEFRNIEASGFKVPNGYFEKVDDDILKRVRQKGNLNAEITPGFSVPEGYFENIEYRVHSNITKNKSGKVVPLFKFKNIAYISGIAASILLIMSLWFNKQGSLEFSDLKYTSIQSYIEDEDLSSYELANLLEIDDLNTNDYSEIDFTDENFEQYLIDNISTEEFLNEQN